MGYRAFVYNLAQRLGLQGIVQNLTGEVLVEAQGKTDALDAFAAALISETLPLARPYIVSCVHIPPRELNSFSILPSKESLHGNIHIPPDNFLCDDCRREMLNPNNRRYRYPFINCTQCGPRYTLITGMPYDRPHTTMTSFTLCKACRAEYEDPTNRRFHAQPLACHVCGPQLDFVSRNENTAGNAALGHYKQRRCNTLKDAKVLCLSRMTAIGTFYRLSGIRFVSSQLTVPAFGIPAINPFSQSTSKPCAIDKIQVINWQTYAAESPE